ncbi:pentatricopeptide repeat-containing protein ELI1, chloroplastic-like [Selaginella moellendorffii]|uniref:pentatricopeptide repeat-containing protein ELI1, chloroplastic-like n=1 Tax=Selaginella moellendorffii TaxID=88036 RepID=UPI000D1CEF67|nr:pentatricopeptide repeat-containing protein ELI1, chloroplastic-like [Selaginella moellendorffii]|eukprot:XP_024526408.1 pentatricopeptide repeat-containing protein ELI1, chloroplastic-like [Selaginella moellendorffii]
MRLPLPISRAPAICSFLRDFSTALRNAAVEQGHFHERKNKSTSICEKRCENLESKKFSDPSLPKSSSRKKINNREARQAYQETLDSGTTPPLATSIAALKACRSIRDLDRGSRIHAELVHLHGDGRNLHTGIWNALVEMYAKCGSIATARQLFETMPVERGLDSWNALIEGYAHTGKGVMALEIFHRMEKENDRHIRPDARSFIAAITACSSMATSEDHGKMASLERGRALHAKLSSLNLERDPSVASALVEMYSKCGSMADARKVFLGDRRNALAWTALILGYVQSGEVAAAVEFFDRMRRHGLAINRRASVAAIGDCAIAAAKEKKIPSRAVFLDRGRVIYGFLAATGDDLDGFAATAMVDLCAKCGRMDEASTIFERIDRKSVAAWTTMVMGYAQCDDGQRALAAFARMRSELSAIDARAYVAGIKASIAAGSSEEGKRSMNGTVVKAASVERIAAIHTQLARDGFETNLFVASALIEGYSRAGSVAEARGVFDRLPRRDLVAWNAMIAGYAHAGDGEIALELFHRLVQQERMEASAQSFIAALKACASLADLATGKKIHAMIRAGRLKNSTVVANSLIGFYGRCGEMEEAHRIFDAIASGERDSVTYNALIAGYSHQGSREDRVFELFDRMIERKIPPTSPTFFSILTSCSRAGLVDKGREFFLAMELHHGIAPKIEHYGCMVDLLGRARHLGDALATIRAMPLEPNAMIWTTLLGACSKWRNTEIGRVAFEELVKIDAGDGAAYALMANAYAGAGMWEESMAIQAMRRSAGAFKQAGESWWIDEGGGVHRFWAGDCSHHPQGEMIVAKVAEFMAKICDHGFVPDLRCALRGEEMAEGDRRDALCGHSERFAMACALVNLKGDEGAIRIAKNLRVCEDCHAVTALVSRVENRSVVCRDSSRFHVFENGKCSCGGFW